MKQLEILDNRRQSNRVVKTVEKDKATKIFDFINCNEFQLYHGQTGLTEDIISEIKCAYNRTPVIFKGFKKQLETLKNDYATYQKNYNEEENYDLIEFGYNLVNDEISELMENEQIADLVLSENLIDSVNYKN